MWCDVQQPANACDREESNGLRAQVCSHVRWSEGTGASTGDGYRASAWHIAESVWTPSTWPRSGYAPRRKRGTL